MRAVALFLLSIVALVPVQALACDLQPWSGAEPPTAETVMDKILAEGPLAYLGKVKVNRIERDKDKFRFDLQTVRQYAGNARETLSVYTPDSHSCAFSAQVGEEKIIRIRENEAEPYTLHLYDSYFFDVPDAEIAAFLDTQKISGEKE